MSSYRESLILVDKLIADFGTLEDTFDEQADKILERVERRNEAIEKKLGSLELKLAEQIERIREQGVTEAKQVRDLLAEEKAKIAVVKRKQALNLRHLKEKVEHAVRIQAKRVQSLEKKLEETRAVEQKARVADAGPARSELDPKAATLAIYDSIIFAISNWSTEGDIAPDFELACQATLFPTIYERVMKGEDDYYIEEVPSSALEVVKRGREYVKMLRETCNASLVDTDVWKNYAPMVHEWWINDALPLLYGARAEDWDKDTPLSLLEVQSWKQQPASRALHFPLIFDGMELVGKHRDQIRENTGLPEFNKQTLQTRLQP